MAEDPFSSASEGFSKGFGMTLQASQVASQRKQQEWENDFRVMTTALQAATISKDNADSVAKIMNGSFKPTWDKHYPNNPFPEVNPQSATDIQPLIKSIHEKGMQGAEGKQEWSMVLPLIGKDVADFRANVVKKGEDDKKYTETIKSVLEPFENQAKEQAKAKSDTISDVQLKALMTADPGEISKVYPQGVPAEHMRIAMSKFKEDKIGDRFGQRIGFEQNKLEAKAVGKTAEAVKEIEEGVGQLNQLFAMHKELVGDGMAGDPVRGAAASGAAALTGGNWGTAKVKAYNDLRKGTVARLRKITSDTGVLTETDAERLIGLVASLGESGESASEKQAALENIFEFAKNGEYKALSKYLTALGIKTEPSGIDGAGGGIPGAPANPNMTPTGQPAGAGEMSEGAKAYLKKKGKL